MRTTRIKVFGVLVAIALAFGVGVYIGVDEYRTSRASAATASGVLNILTGSAPQDVDLSQFWDAWKLLDQYYIPTHASSSLPTQQERIYGAIAGLTDSYGDPYTVFFPPVQAQIFKENISGEFSGVGMELAQDKNGQLIVVAPLKGSPAQKAGILTGDIVLGIDGTSTEGMTVEQAVTLIRGPKNTTVQLNISRGVDKPFSVSIVRDTIQIPEITTTKRPDGVFVIQLYTFSANSADLFRNALREFMLSGSTKLIFDLRGNPGGYLEAAVEMASYFLPVGDVVVTEDFKGKQDSISHRSVGYNVFAGRTLSMVILLDQGSASASEILAGALAQHNVAKLVGTRSFGKGSVQQLMDIGGGAQLKITIARWLTPNGSSISDGGLQPDIPVDRTQDDIKANKDPQMDAAVQYLLSH